MKDYWNDLSMSDRNEFIKVAVRNGLRTPEEIRSKYNEFADGGTLKSLPKPFSYQPIPSVRYDGGGTLDNPNILPEAVVTPRGSYIRYNGDEYVTPTYRQYEKARAQEERVNAVNKMLQQESPVVPVIPSQSLLSKGLGYLGFSDEARLKMFDPETNVQTCINTATSMYPSSRVSGNKTFADNPLLYGFVPISNRRAEVGDLMQFNNSKNVPHHMTMITGFNANGEPALSYSNGETGQWTVNADGYNVEVVPSMKQDNDNWNSNWEAEEDHTSLYSIGTPHTYRYVGTQKDKRTWQREYKKKFKR